MNRTATATLPTIQQWCEISRELREAEEAENSILADNADTPVSEAVVDRLVAARAAMLSTPAPNCAALLDKLEIVFERDRDDDDFTKTWDREILAQTFADMRRLLQISARDRLATVARYAERMASQLAADLLDISEAATFADGDPAAVVNLAEDALTNQAILAEQLKELADLIEAT